MASYEADWAPERGSVGVGVPDDADSPARPPRSARDHARDDVGAGFGSFYWVKIDGGRITGLTRTPPTSTPSARSSTSPRHEH